MEVFGYLFILLAGVVVGYIGGYGDGKKRTGLKALRRWHDEYDFIRLGNRYVPGPKRRAGISSNPANNSEKA